MRIEGDYWEGAFLEDVRGGRIVTGVEGMRFGEQGEGA